MTDHPLQSILLAANATHHTQPPTVRVNRPRYHYYASRYALALTAIVILSLVILRLFRVLGHRYSPSSRSRWKNLAALEAAQRNLLYLYQIPTWLYGPETVADIIWTVLYCGLFFFYGLNRTTLVGGDQNTANQMGVIAFSQLPIIIILIQKNNPISLVTGITYQKLNYLHRASSRACLLFSWLHVIIWFIPVVHAGHLTRPYILWGYLAIAGFTILWITSFRVIRRAAYEFFLVAHIIGTLMFLVGALFHWIYLGYWVWPAIAIWIFDRMFRGARLVWYNKLYIYNNNPKCGSCTIELLNHDVMRVRIQREGFTWTAGQHAFLVAPSISSSRIEAHPFSIANVPSETSNEALCLIRVHSGFTRRLRNSLVGNITTSIPIYIEGPYGTSHSLSPYSSILLIAGGTGVTFTSAFFIDLIQRHTSTSRLKKLRLLWHVRHADDVAWLSPLLNEAAEKISGNLEVVVDIYVTKTHVSDEPTLTAGFTDRLLEGVAPGYIPRPPTTGTATPIGTPFEIPLNGDYTFRSHHSFETLTETVENEPLIPKVPPTLHALDNDLGLSAASSKMIKWHTGRANLQTVIAEDVESCEGRMQVSVCGPVQLLRATRRAVAEVNSPRAVAEGQCSIDFYEETLGA